MKRITAQAPYDQPRSFSTNLRGQPVKFFSKPGLQDWNQVKPSTVLLAEKANLPPDGRILLLGCGHGALPVAVSRLIPEGELWLADTNIIALEVSRLTLQENQITTARVNVGTSVLPDHLGRFDAVLIDLPKGRKLAQRWLLEAYFALRPGGQLYLAGANQQGIQSIAQDAQSIFGEMAVIGYKKGNRILRLVKPASAAPAAEWCQEPGIMPGTWLEFEVEYPTRKLALRSLPGVFSAEHIDEGTRLLLSVLEVLPGTRVLDLGCGYGVLGIYAVLSGAAWVDLVDADLYATASASENLRLHGITNANVILSDVLSGIRGDGYAQVVTNPPFHSGQSTDYQITQAFIEQSWKVLQPGGQLWLVANKFIRYDQWLKQLFYKVDRIAETGRFIVWRGTKQEQ